MKGSRVVVVIAMLLWLGSLFASQDADASTFRVTLSDQHRIVLELSSPEPQIESVRFNGESFSRIRMPGSEPSAEEGSPELPIFSALVAIPVNATYTVNYEYSNVKTIRDVKPQPVVADETKLTTLSSAYIGNEKYPASLVTSSEDAFLRDFRVLPLQAYPLSWDPVENSLTQYGDIRITIELSYGDADGEPIPYTTYSSTFEKLYDAQILNFADYRNILMAPRNARVLLIHGNSSDQTFITKLNEFVNWKRQKGFEVTVASTSVAGTSNTAIKNYIQSQYNNSDTRPDFIILLGDVGGSFGVPTWYETESGYNGEGDYPYTYLSGNDMLGDAFIGRISAENISQLTTLFSKIYTYEKNVNITPPTASWLNRMLIIGDPSTSGISCVYVGQHIHEIAQYANPDYTFIENYSSGYSSTMNSGVNQGVGFFSYRGYYGVSGWSPSSSLTNGFKLPHASVLTCGTGSFSGTSLSESFMRLGTEAVPAGAVTCIGMATTGTHTGLNNILSAGIMNGVFTHKMRTMGEALLNGRIYLHTIQSATLPTHVKSFAHWCNLMGDPTLEAWVGIPQQMAMDAPASIPMGTTTLEVSVNDILQMPMENVCVTAFSSTLNSVVAKAYTGADGVAVLYLPSSLSSDILLTASKHDCKPYQQSVLIDAIGAVIYSGHLVVDDGSNGSSGNADGFANATETIALHLELRNTTAETVSGLNATISTTNPHVQMIQSTSGYLDMAPGTVAFENSPFLFTLDSNILPQENIRFVLSVTGSDTLECQSVFYLGAFNARLSVSSYTVTDGANGILDPGENSYLGLQISNTSIYSALDIYGELQSLNDLLVVSDSLSYFGNVLPSMQSNSVDGFEVFARPLLVPGMLMPMRLRLYNANGFEQESLFSLPIGSVSQTTPLGPDEYGYLIYDVTDTAFPDCPTYEWMEIVPSLGGGGSLITGFTDSGQSGEEGEANGAVTLKVLDLPFIFPFYGIDYNQITVCVNGFIALGITNEGDFRNARLPGGQGPSPMIAAFWDDLYIPAGGGIYKYYDAANHSFIIEYYNLKNGYNHSSVETFQVIFYDPQFYPTGLGDGMVKIQYQVFNNVDVGGGGYTPLHGNYCTIGIKDHTNTRGLEYTYNNTYPQAAAPLSNGKALLITTTPVMHQSAYLVVRDVIIDDTNHDQLLEPGESAEIGIKLNNLGIDTATNVNVTISSLTQYVTVQTSQSEYPNIPGSSSAINQIPLSFSVSESCPGGTPISFLCQISIAGNSWTYPLNFTVEQPDIDITGIYINDADGNCNGILEPGETATLIVYYKNNALVNARDLTSNVTCMHEHVTLLNDSQLIHVIPSGSTVQAIYRFMLSPQATLGTNVTFYLTYLSDQISAHNEQLTVSIGTTGMSNDFENSNGNFVASPASNAWQWGSSSASGAHSGTKVWGTLLNQQYPNNVNWTLTSPSISIGSNFMLEFWHWYAMENTYDGGNVKISTNGSTWTLLTPVGGYPNSYVAALGAPGYTGTSSWAPVQIDLGAYANQNVRFRWTFAADSMIQGQGWFIDDVATSGFVNFAGLLSGEVLTNAIEPDYTSMWITNQSGVCTNPDSTGAYAYYLPEGTHTVQASAPGYLPESVSGLLFYVNNPAITHDFFLLQFQPVAGFQHTHTETTVNLAWTAPAEPSFPITGYKVMRKMNAGAFEMAEVTTATTFSEMLSLTGTYHYYVQVLYDAGESLPSEIYSVAYPFTANPENPAPPLVTRLLPNYPNPFNPTTTISFDLAAPGKSELQIFNMRGQIVKTLCNNTLGAGNHRYVWDGCDASNRRVASGIYFYRLSTPHHTETRKMLMMK